MLDEEINDFYRRIKLKAHFRDNTIVKKQTEEEIFKKPTNKKWAANKNHYTIESFLVATKGGFKDKLKTIRACKYTNLSKTEHKALEELKYREDCHNKR